MSNLIKQNEDQRQRALVILTKVTITLNKAELEALAMMLYAFVTASGIDALEDKVIVFRVYRYYELKIRRKLLAQKKEVKLKLDLEEAEAIYTGLMNLENDLGPFEANVVGKIMDNINQQTL